MSSPSPAAEISPHFTLRQRLALWAISWAGWLLVRLIGPTLRFRVSIEEGGPASEYERPVIYVFWHRCIIPATYHFRGHGIAVMTSSSFDGEYIARLIEKLGYRAVRGSSTRGGVRALLGMHTEVEQGRSVAFTIDGPRGPVYVAKPGAALLARNVGVPVLAFHVAVEHAWQLNSWDRLLVPKPFSRVLVRVSRLIRIPAEADSAALQRYQEEIQATLDRAREWAEAELGRG